ncbi:hypothetical protein IY145_24450 [Methylosinus sp. H3A]|uniref:hypothetical protein n=1 Tax=Methylosinus sp. H3A TaxID=2785786 RepID=UPI0018C1F01E|nr:hypothetical protein [Methylosinus sp. H3A]
MVKSDRATDCVGGKRSSPGRMAGLTHKLSECFSKVDRRFGPKSIHFRLSGLRSRWIISASGEVVCALCRFEDVGAGFEGPRQGGDGSLGNFAQTRLQLGKCLLDQVHVGAIRLSCAMVEFEDSHFERDVSVWRVVCYVAYQ